MPLKEQLLGFIQILFNPFNIIAFIAVIIFLSVRLTVHLKQRKEYLNSSYYQITKLPYSTVKRDIGRFGEYLTYKYLKNFETNGAKFLFNLYIPKENGETTEIDVLMICSKGIFVIESKNYSGWIFGREEQKNWCQSLPAGRGRSHKEYFYNPIMQNRSHIKHLKALLGEQIPMRSIIAFSDRCKLKNIKTKSSDVIVLNRYDILPIVEEICYHIPNEVLSENDITTLYNKLFPYTQVDEITKIQHIDNIQNNLSCSEVKTDSIEEPILDDTESNSETKAGKTIETSEHQFVELESKEQYILKCPKCGGALVLRTAKKGDDAGNKFYGCSNFPKCRYIQSIE